jgi:hypothetical protein
MVLLPADGVVMVFTADTKVKVEGKINYRNMISF